MHRFFFFQKAPSFLHCVFCIWEHVRKHRIGCGEAKMGPRAPLRIKGAHFGQACVCLCLCLCLRLPPDQSTLLYRMSFVPEQEAQHFDRQVITYWSRLMHCDVVFSTSQAWWTWSGICCSTTCGCPMASVAVDHSFIDGNNTISGHRFTFQFNTTTTCPTHSTPIHPLPTNEQTHLPTQTTWSSPSPPNHSKETSLHHPKEHPQTILQQPH